MSREHLVSRCLFEKEVRVKGLPWCRDIEKTIGIEGLTSKVLCRHHNSALSELDNAAKQTLDTLLEACKLFDARRSIVTTRWTVKYFITDMLLLERWCLKTLININLSGKPGLPVDPEGRPNGPTEELIRIVCGLDRFKAPKGLYRIAGSGKNIDLGDGHIHITTKSRDGRLAAAEFRLWGLRFFLSLIPEPIRWEGGALMRGEHKQWFNTWDRKKRRVNSHLMTFTYPKE
jgi:hypothetical protein